MNEKKDLLEFLIASLPNGIIASDSRGRITVFNKRAEEILGYSADEVMLTPLERLYYEPREPRNIGRLLLSSTDNNVSNYETLLRSKNGQVIPVRLSAAWLYDSKGERIGSIGYLEDLRSAKDAERRLELLLRVNNIVAEAQTLREGLQMLAGMIVSLLSSKFCLILLLDESGTSLVVEAAYSTPQTGEALSWDPGLGRLTPLSQWPGQSNLLNAGDPIVFRLRDKIAEPDLLAFSQQLKLTADVQSLLAVPLKIGNRVAGLLYTGEVRTEERTAFTQEKIELAAAIAAQTSILIDRERQHQITERRKRLLARLDAALLQIGDEQDTAKLQQEIVRLAAQLFDCDVAGLCINSPQLKEMELAVTFGLPTELVGKIVPHAGGKLGEVATTGKPCIVHEYNQHPDQDAILRPFALKTVMAVALKQAGEVDAVLFVADRTDRRQPIQSDVDILERFAARASIAIRTSRLISSEQRVFDRLTILHKISDYLLREQPGAALEKILHVVLTGVTADYGLGFNRAMLFLRDEVNGDLVGRKGIGQLQEQEARAAWEMEPEKKLYDFAEYTRWLEQGALPSTPVDEIIIGLRLPVTDPPTDILSLAVLEQKWQGADSNAHDHLPQAFRAALDPTTTVVAVPLIARDHVLGLLVVDNKFTQAPITRSDIESLLTFANTVAIALDNIALFQQTEQGRFKLSSLYKASNELVSRADHRQVLEDIVHRTWLASGALSVRLILIDEMGRARALHQAGDMEEIPAKDAVRPGGIATEVMTTGKPFMVKDKYKMAERVNPLWLRDRAVASLCLPLSLQEKCIGVMWINYEAARHFTEFEVDALQLYANQAAIAYDSARRMEELEHMRRAANALAAAAAPREVLNQIVQSARDVLQADSAAIWSYDDIRHVFIEESSAVEGIILEDWEAFRKKEPRENGTARTVMEEKYVLVEDARDAEKYPFLGTSTHMLLDRIGVQCFQGVALDVGGEILGVLYVNYNQRRGFTEEEQETARTFANQAALALKKARLLDQVNRARDAALVVANVTALEKDLQKTLRAIVEGTSQALGSDLVTLYTYDEESQRFIVPPAMEGVRDEAEMLQLRKGGSRAVVHKVLALDDMHVAYDAARDTVMAGPFVRREGIKSSVGIPLVARGRKVGVMFVNFRSSHRFNNDELRNIGLFAKQAAVAIRNGQLYEQLQRRVAFLESLSRAGSAITGTLDLNEILRSIAHQAWALASSQGRQMSFVEIKLINDMKVQPAAAYPSEEFTKVVKETGEKIDLETSRSGRIGILGRAVQDGADQIVNDVAHDPDYVAIHDETKSQLVVLLRIGHSIIGAISVEHPDYDAFDEAIVEALKALAAHASIAIENAGKYEELRKSKGLVGARTALAWMGMTSSIWRHAVEGQAVTIREQTRLLRKNLEQTITPDTLTRIQERLAMIERQASAILQKPITPVLSADVGVESVLVNDLIQERMSRLWQSEPYKSVELKLDLELAQGTSVRASADWLRRVLDVLVDNAVKAVSQSSVKRVSITAKRAQANVEISISDTGMGIPEEISAKIFRSPITESTPAKGMGMGLLMASAIVQTYGGELRVGHTSPAGTTMIIELPLEE